VIGGSGTVLPVSSDLSAPAPWGHAAKQEYGVRLGPSHGLSLSEKFV